MWRSLKDGGLAGVLPLILLGLLACHNWFGPDIWYHLTWGRDLLVGDSWFPVSRVLLRQPTPSNPYWLYQILIEALFAHAGPLAVAVAHIALWILIASLWGRVVAIHKTRFMGPLFLLTFVVCVQLRLEYRPEIISYLALMIFVYALSLGELSAVTFGVMVLVEIFWVNSHPYFILGPGLAAMTWLFALPGTRFRLGLLLPTLLLATLMNPFGWRIWETILAYNQVIREMRLLVEELRPTYQFAWWYWPLPIFWIYFALVVIGMVLGLSKRSRWRGCIFALIGAWFGAMAFRAIPLFMILSAPVAGYWIELFASHPSALKRRLEYLGPRVLNAGVMLLILAVVSGAFHRFNQSATRFGLAYEWAEYPIGAAGYLRELNFRGRIFNESNDGGYLEYMLPESEVLADSYFSDPAITAQSFASRNEPSLFSALDSRFHFAAVVIKLENIRLVDYLLHDPRWQTAYSDSHRLVFLRAEIFPQERHALVEGRHYHGEDLRRSSYRELPALWIGLATARQDHALLAKLVEEFSRASRVPSSLVTGVLTYSLAFQDREMGLAAVQLIPRMFISQQGDPQVLSELLVKLSL